MEEEHRIIDKKPNNVKKQAIKDACIMKGLCKAPKFKLKKKSILSEQLGAAA